jgi:hypothetical protein
MKIALCLHGYFANAGGGHASEVAYEYIKRKVLKNDVDIFVHSWDMENKHIIENLYEPTMAHFEPQQMFHNELKQFDETWFNEEFARPQTMYKTNTIFRGLSYLYSRARTVELKKEYEKKHGFTYDCVMLARFDISTRGKEHPQTYYVTNMNFNTTLDMTHLYSAYWNQMNHGYADHWFYSNSHNMDIVGNLYDKVMEYYQENSEYVKAVTQGWPESNAFDEFSNECMNTTTERSSQLVTFPKWGCIDNHKLYKWYFMETGLHNISKYIDITEDTPSPKVY